MLRPAIDGSLKNYCAVSPAAKCDPSPWFVLSIRAIQRHARRPASMVAGMRLNALALAVTIARGGEVVNFALRPAEISATDNQVTYEANCPMRRNRSLVLSSRSSLDSSGSSCRRSALGNTNKMSVLSLVFDTSVCSVSSKLLSSEANHVDAETRPIPPRPSQRVTCAIERSGTSMTCLRVGKKTPERNAEALGQARNKQSSRETATTTRCSQISAHWRGG